MIIIINNKTLVQGREEDGSLLRMVMGKKFPQPGIEPGFGCGGRSSEFPIVLLRSLINSLLIILLKLSLVLN